MLEAINLFLDFDARVSLWRFWLDGELLDTVVAGAITKAGCDCDASGVSARLLDGSAGLAGQR